MPNVACPQCGRTHYQKPTALVAVCYGCGYRWTATGEGTQGKKYPLDKFPGRAQNLTPGRTRKKVAEKPETNAETAPEHKKKIWEWEF
ncbi:hypothetical protein CO251_04650 [Sulfobacillus sp. hq2]|nr:hypothetical protein CO251_04650 [Sulfobacillus sp. hq2]